MTCHCRQAITVVEASRRGGREEVALPPDVVEAAFDLAEVGSCWLCTGDGIVNLARDDAEEIDSCNILICGSETLLWGRLKVKSSGELKLGRIERPAGPK